MMQIMPGTARSLGLNNPFDPISNLRAGARYLRQQIDRFGRVDLALAAYNAGPERRSLRYGRIPAIPETQHYVRTILTNWGRLIEIDLAQEFDRVDRRALGPDVGIVLLRQHVGDEVVRWGAGQDQQLGAGRRVPGVMKHIFAVLWLGIKPVILRWDLEIEHRKVEKLPVQCCAGGLTASGDCYMRLTRHVSDHGVQRARKFIVILDDQEMRAHFCQRAK